MAKLNKLLEHHFCIPILLKPIGSTSPQTISYYQHLLSTHFCSFQLGIDQASQVITYLKDILKQRPTNTNPFYTLKFNQLQPSTQYPQLQLSYKSQFVIGINDSQQQDPQKIKDNFIKFRKQLTDERREEIAIFLLKADKEAYYKVSLVDKSFVFMPDVMEQDLVSFLEMEMVKIVKNVVLWIGEEIKMLQGEENQYIVFNKNEEKPEQRTLKRKKKGRCCKIIGDYCLMVGSEDDALEYYKEGFELLKKLDDYLWMMAIEQGRAAAYLAKYNSQADKQQPPQQSSSQYLTLLNQHIIQAIQHIKKSRLQPFIVQSYFIAFHAFSLLSQKHLLQQWVSIFISQQLKYHVAEDQAIYLSQIGLIYKNLSMFRKCNYYFFLSAEIYLIKQPQIARMFLLEIKNNYPQMKEWTKLYSLVLKELIKSDPNDAFQGHTYGELLDVCHGILPQAEIYMLTQKLNFSYFEKVQHSFRFLKLGKFNVQKPGVIPKLNRLIKIKKEGGGVLIAPRKKEEEYKYEANQNIKFDCEFTSEIRFPISLKLGLVVVPSTETKTHNTLLEIKSLFSFNERFMVVGNYVITALSIQIWNYWYNLKLPKEIAIEVYEEHSHYEIVVEDELVIEKSSQFHLDFKVVNTKPAILSHMVKMNISIYYSLEVGLQQNIIFLSQQQLQSSTLYISCKQSQNQSLTQHPNPNTPNFLHLSLSKFKVHREYLKKVEITLEYIRTETSKYQINVDKMIPVRFREKILFEVKGVKSESRVKLLAEKKGVAVWQNEFVMQVEVSKDEEDKKVYEIEMYDKEGTLVGKRILGDEWRFTETMRVDKAAREVSDLEKYLSQCAYLTWRSMTNEKQHGTVTLRTPSTNLNKQLIQKSLKQIHLTYLIDNSPQTLPIISIKNHQKLTIKYSVTSTVDFNHSVYLESIEFKETSVVGYVMEGKTVVKRRKECENSVEVEFCTSYSNRYVVILEFEDEVYVSEQVVSVEYEEGKE